MDEMEETLTKELNSGSSACQWHGRAGGDATVTPWEELASQWVTLHQMVPSLTHRFQRPPCSTHCVVSTMGSATTGYVTSKLPSSADLNPWCSLHSGLFGKAGSRSVTHPPKTASRLFSISPQAPAAFQCLSPPK